MLEFGDTANVATPMLFQSHLGQTQGDKCGAC